MQARRPDRCGDLSMCAADLGNGESVARTSGGAATATPTRRCLCHHPAVAEEWADLRGMVDDIVRAGAAEKYWWSDPDMRALLHGLASDEPQSVTMGLSYLWG